MSRCQKLFVRWSISERYNLANYS